jgi:uncharacterized protein (TIGR03437 family)
MLRRLAHTVAYLLLVTAGLSAQQQTITDNVALPPGTVGTPYTINFGEGLQNIPATPDISLTWGFSSSGSLPPGMSVSGAGLFSGTPTTPGSYSFTITLTFTVGAQGQSFGFTYLLNTTMSIQGSTGPVLSVDPGGLVFSFPAGAAASSLNLSVGNHGNQARGFSASASVTNGAGWLSVSPSSGTAPAFGQGSILVTADPSRLSPGTYLGSVAVSSAPGSERFDVPVVMTVTNSQQGIGLSQSGLTFRAVSGGGAPPAQSFSVLNVGAGSLNWTASTSTLSGGVGWLSASPSNGSSNATTAPGVQVTVNPSGLAPGDYYGQVQISAPDIGNSPQAVSVVLTVLPPTADPGPSVLPTGLIFVGAAGGPNPAAQSVSITNLTSKTLNFSTATFFERENKWFTAPPTGKVEPGQPSRIAIQPALAGLAAGVYQGELDIRFAENNVTRRVDILLVVIPTGAASPKPGGEPRFAGGCLPTKLYPVFTQLGQSFTTTAAWPTSLEVTVVDDCGAPMTFGSVVATFSSGDPLVSLTSLHDGRWTGTWQPRTTPTAPVTITASAQLVLPPIKGTAAIGGSLQPNTSTPLIAAGGVVSDVSFAPLAPLAPGGYVAILGSNLAQGFTPAGDPPLPTQLNGTQVILAGRPLPLRSTSDGRINAIVPFDVPVNSTHQLIVQRGTTYSVPETVTIAAAQPAIFTQDQSGKGPALVNDVQPDGTMFVVTPDNPATAGDSLVIYCAGLGPVDPPVDAGTAAPDSPPSQTTTPVMVTIGGMPADVQFAALAPGMVGVYQIGVTVPSGVAPAPDAPLVVSVGDQTSPPAAIAVQ